MKRCFFLFLFSLVAFLSGCSLIFNDETTSDNNDTRDGNPPDASDPAGANENGGASDPTGGDDTNEPPDGTDTNTPPPEPTTETYLIAYSHDDVEQNVSDGAMDLYGVELDIAPDFWVGLRYDIGNIPQNATIDSAFLSFRRRSDTTATTNATISIQNSVSPADFTASVNNLSERDLLSTSVPWNNIESWNQDDLYMSPNIKTLIQPLVSFSNWSASSSIVIIVKTTLGYRSSRSFNSSQDGVPNHGPTLTITYTENE